MSSTETEYKFLVATDGWKAIPPARIIRINQHYLPEDMEIALASTAEGRSLLIRHDNGHMALAIPPDVTEAFGAEGFDALTDNRGHILLGSGCEARIRQADTEYYLTIKADTAHYASRLELEFPIPQEQAQALLPLCPHRLEKTRHVLHLNGQKWEVDVYGGKNAGLVTAEIEAAEKPAALPDWLGQEVTHHKKFGNRQLARIPYGQWGQHASPLRA